MTYERFERDLPAVLAELYLGPIPDYHDDVLARASRTRQRPAWTFPERWLPMDLVERQRARVPHLPWRTIAIVALVALLMAAFASVWIGSRPVVLPPPYGPAANGAIAYASGGAIYSIATPGATPRLLVGGSTNQAPTYSRQGDRVSFFRVVSDTGDCDCEVWLANADGSNAHKVADAIHNPTSWEWSPDGSTIAIAGDAGLTIVPTDGSSARHLNLAMPAQSVTWRPGTDQILFRGGDPNGAGSLYLVKPDGTGLTHLDIPGAGIGGQHDFGHGFSWSPDGRRIAYELVENLDPGVVGVDGGGLRLHVADVDPTGKVTSEQRLEFDPKADNELQPVWLPQGDRIVFQTRENGSDYLSVAALPSTGAPGPAKRIGPESVGGGGIGFEVAPDGHSLLVLFWEEKTTWRYDIDAGTYAPLTLGILDVSSFQRLAP